MPRRSSRPRSQTASRRAELRPVEEDRDEAVQIALDVPEQHRRRARSEPVDAEEAVAKLEEALLRPPAHRQPRGVHGHDLDVVELVGAVCGEGGEHVALRRRMRSPLDHPLGCPLLERPEDGISPRQSQQPVQLELLHQLGRHRTGRQGADSLVGQGLEGLGLRPARARPRST